jgi:hypothetical protein
LIDEIASWMTSSAWEIQSSGEANLLLLSSRKLYFPSELQNQG